MITMIYFSNWWILCDFHSYVHHISPPKAKRSPKAIFSAKSVSQDIVPRIHEVKIEDREKCTYFSEISSINILIILEPLLGIFLRFAIQ